MKDQFQTFTRDGELRVEIPLAEYRALLDAADEDAVDAAILRRLLVADPNRFPRVAPSVRCHARAALGVGIDDLVEPACRGSPDGAE